MRYCISIQYLETSMAAVLRWTSDDEAPVPPPVPPRRYLQRSQRAPGQPLELPPEIGAAIWRGNELGSSVQETISTGWAELDAELPGGGWPCHAITEVLQPQPGVCEWRLLAPALKRIVAAGKSIVVVGPAQRPHLPGLRFLGLDEKQLVWVQADAPAQRLWTTEQLVKSNACGALISWLPQARQEQIRRLQICAQSCEGPVFLCRPAAAEHEASAAPLRVQLTYGLDWELRLRILKRKGAVHEGAIALRSVPGGLESIITPRLLKPSASFAQRVQPEAVPDVLGSVASGRSEHRRVPAH
jgi:protein ImuA